MPRVTVAPHTPALAADMNAVADQVIMTFPTAAARTAAIPTPVEGMHTYRTDADVMELWSGSAWVLAVPWTRAPTLRIRQASDQAFSTGVLTQMTWTADAVYPAAGATGFMTYGTNSIVTGRVGIYLAVLSGVAATGRFSWRIHTGGGVKAYANATTDFNSANCSYLTLAQPGVTLTAHCFGLAAGTLAGDSGSNPHGLTVTFLGDA